MPLPTVEECLARARREVLSDVERAELEQEDGAAETPIAEPLNPRNEAAALSALYAPARLAQVLGGAEGASGGDASTTARRQELDALAASFTRRTGGPAEAEGEETVVASTEDVDESSAALAAWALGGVDGASPAAVAPAVFSDARAQRRKWRGLVACRDFAPGDVALCLPVFSPSAPPQQQQQQQSRALAVTYASARASDLGRALSALGLDDESLALLFTMADRHDPDSPHAPFWRALPGGGGGEEEGQEQEGQGDNRNAGFGTPLGAGVSDGAVRRALGGTPLGERCEAARGHLAEAYASLEPAIAALLRAYPQHLQKAWFARPAFLWAAELWYAYALQLALPPPPSSSSSSSSTPAPAPAPVPALVPLFSLANHSAWPHAVAFSDCSADGRQRVRVFRPVKRGEELLISYGALANDDLLLFYGFALEGGNPFDARAVRRQLREAAAGDGPSGGAAEAAAETIGRKEWRALHEAALARVEEDLSSSSGSGSGGGGEEKWTEAERAFFAHARTFLRGFLAAERAIQNQS